MNSNSDEPTIPTTPSSDTESKLSDALIGIYRPANQSAPLKAADPARVTAQDAEVSLQVSPPGGADGTTFSPLAVARLLAARYASENAERHKADSSLTSEGKEQDAAQQAAEQTEALSDGARDPQPEVAPVPLAPQTDAQADVQPQEKANGMDPALTDDTAAPMTEVVPEIPPHVSVPQVKIYAENLEPQTVPEPQMVETHQAQAVETDLVHPVLVEPQAPVAATPETDTKESGLPSSVHSVQTNPVQTNPVQTVSTLTVAPEVSPARAPDNSVDPAPVVPAPVDPAAADPVAVDPVAAGRPAEPLPPQPVPVPSEPPAPDPLPANALRGASSEPAPVPDLRARTLAAIYPAAASPSPAVSEEGRGLPAVEAAMPEIDPTAQMMGSIWRSRWPILGAALLTGALAYGLSSLQKPNYVATASLASTLPSVNDVVGASVVTAPVLASGAMNQALQGPELTRALIERVSKLTVADDVKQVMLGSLQRHLKGQGNSPVGVEGFEGDKVNNGLYQVSGHATTAAAAQTLANTAAEVVLGWDVQRAREQLKLARTSIQGQLKALEKDTPNNDLYDNAHEAARSRLLQNLAVTGAAQESAVGTLEMVSQAMPPAQPLSPKPLRQALLSGLLALLVAAGLTAFLGGRFKKP